MKFYCNTNLWKIFEMLRRYLATVAIPLLIGFGSHWFSTAIKERELQGKFVELSISILRDKPDKNYTPIRKWAVEVINTYSGVPMGEEAEEDVINKISLPVGAVPKGAIVGGSIVEGSIVGGAIPTLPDDPNAVN